jgi:lipoprotein-releasing system permease protein
VVQKRKEIGILRAVGATRGQMMRVFLWQGAMVGAAGALIGTAFGMVLISIFSRVLRSDTGKPLFTLELDLRLTVIAFVVATVLGLIAAVLPARNAARLDPAQAIRG